MALRSLVPDHPCPTCGFGTGSFRSQADVGSAIGLSQSTISKYERGLYDIDAAHHARMLALFGLCPHEYLAMIDKVSAGAHPFEVVREWLNGAVRDDEQRSHGYAWGGMPPRWTWTRLVRVATGWRPPRPPG